VAFDLALLTNPSKETWCRNKIWIGKEVCFLAFDTELITGLEHGSVAHEIRDFRRFRKIPWFDLFCSIPPRLFGWLYMLCYDSEMESIGSACDRVRAKRDEVASDAMIHGYPEKPSRASEVVGDEMEVHMYQNTCLYYVA